MSLYVEIEKQLGSFHLQAQFETDREALGLLGISGSGKSVTLKCIAGLLRPDRGIILLDGKTLFDSKAHIDLPPQKREIGYLFQEYALFPNMTVWQNIAAGLRNASSLSVADCIRRFSLEGLEQHYPHQLSGGQKQRTALARILINHPRSLLLDEPFSALDRPLRFRLQQELQELLQEMHIPAILVTHDMDEVAALCGQAAILHNGQLTESGMTAELLQHPKTEAGLLLTGFERRLP